MLLLAVSTLSGAVQPARADICRDVDRVMADRVNDKFNAGSCTEGRETGQDAARQLADLSKR